MKKIIVLCVSMLFVFSLGVAAFGEETAQNPWDKNVQTTTKTGDKSRTKAVKANSKGSEKAKAGNAKKVSLAKAEKVEKKEPGQKKKFLFW